MQEQIKKIEFLKSQDLMPTISKYLPFDIVDQYKAEHPGKYREKLYPLQLVLQGYVFQAIDDDKSDQNAVVTFANYYDNLQDKLANQEEKAANAYHKQPKGRGRPKIKHINIQRSKTKEISVNTASYSGAKQRFPLELMERVAANLKSPPTGTWNGHRVLIVDGTTVTTVQNKELREYFMPDEVQPQSPVPIAKLLGIIDLYNGQMLNLEIDNYRSSESKMYKKSFPSLPKDFVLLGDDLYSSYGYMCHSLTNGYYLISEGKHKRIDKQVEKLGKNDDLVEWKNRKRPVWFTEEDELPKTIHVRRISYKDPRNPKEKRYIYTTLLDEKKYKATDILALYLRRWDIEVSFEEIKKVMKMEHLRSKSVEGVYKEIYAHWISYNIIRTIMYEAFVVKIDDFFSLREAFLSSIASHQERSYNLDRLGRSYKRKSPGRYYKKNKQTAKEA